MTSSEGAPQARNIISFWEKAGDDRWFTADPAFDAAIREGFSGVHRQALAGELDDWREIAEGALALLILLDQFSRNLFRGQPEAYAGDAKAHGIATAAIERGFDQLVEPALRQFFYTPFMHAETLADQDRSVTLYRELFPQLGGKCLQAAERHREIIIRFGRFPHRNSILGRRMTPDEQAFLDAGGFSG